LDHPPTSLSATSDRCRDLTAIRAVENNPHGEFIGKVLEMVLDSRSHEHQVAWLEPVALAVVNQDHLTQFLSGILERRALMYSLTVFGCAFLEEMVLQF
jgi:hypothetical protein